MTRNGLNPLGRRMLGYTLLLSVMKSTSWTPVLQICGRCTGFRILPIARTHAIFVGGRGLCEIRFASYRLRYEKVDDHRPLCV